MFNEESNNYGLSKIKDRVFGEIEKCWDENELNYYDVSTKSYKTLPVSDKDLNFANV